jgi:curved DNA-binding protein CbpA
LHADHFEVLGVPRDADDRQVKEAYLRQVKRLHPDRYADPAFADLKLELQALFIRVGEAYEALRHRARRTRYAAELAPEASQPAREASSPAPTRSAQQAATDAIENALMAEDAILRADQHILESRYWDAIQILEAVIPWILSQSLKHAAQVRLARAYAKNPYWVRRGEDLLQRVVREDPSRADAYFVLGTIYRENGLRNRAISMFRKVLDLKPNHGPAAAEIRSLEHPASSKQPLGRT